MVNIKKEHLFRTEFVIIHRGRYFGLDFLNRIIKEITFEEAFGCSCFDWDNMICIADKDLIKQYQEIRGIDGCGLNRYFNKRNDLRNAEMERYRKYEEEINEVRKWQSN